MQIRVENKDYQIDFQLNDSQASQDLVKQLPLSIDVDNFGSSEKIFYPHDELNTNNAPLAYPEAGNLCYYEPWGDVVMYYKATSPARGLFSLGQGIAAQKDIKKLSGTITVKKLG